MTGIFGMNKTFVHDGKGLGCTGVENRSSIQFSSGLIPRQTAGFWDA
jgi:hypothetical protein